MLLPLLSGCAVERGYSGDYNYPAAYPYPYPWWGGEEEVYVNEPGYWNHGYWHNQQWNNGQWHGNQWHGGQQPQNWHQGHPQGSPHFQHH